MTDPQKATQRIHLKALRLPELSDLGKCANLFLLECESRGLTTATLRFYHWRLGLFVTYLEGQGVRDPASITSAHVRAYFLTFADKSPYYLFGAARVAKTWLGFLVREGILDNTPMRSVRMPKLPKDALAPFTQADVQAILAACENERDKALVLTLLDSGVRANELCRLSIADIDPLTGAVRVVAGKGRKDRTTFVGAQTRKALTKYLRGRESSEPNEPLFVGLTTGLRLQYNGLRAILRRLGDRADVSDCSAHRFRRTFAISSLRAGMPIMQLAAMMGHGSLPILQRYLRLIADDLEDAHRVHGAVDFLLSGKKGR